MSGIYIPGLRVPGENEDELWIAVRSDGTVTFDAECGWTTNKDKAVSVPEHGRLIDADALFKEIGMDGRFGILEAMCIQSIIHDAPTIIPAEED